MKQTYHINTLMVKREEREGLVGGREKGERYR